MTRGADLFTLQRAGFVQGRRPQQREAGTHCILTELEIVAARLDAGDVIARREPGQVTSKAFGSAQMIGRLQKRATKACRTSARVPLPFDIQHPWRMSEDWLHLHVLPQKFETILKAAATWLACLLWKNNHEAAAIACDVT